MPGFNGLGPNGQGSMTGRGLGPCNKENNTTVETTTTNNNDINLPRNFARFGRGMGRGCRGGRGRGFGNFGGRNRGNF